MTNGEDAVYYRFPQMGDFFCQWNFWGFVIPWLDHGIWIVQIVTPAQAGVGLYSVSNANHKNYKIVINVNLKDPIPAYAGMTKLFEFCLGGGV